MRSVGLVGPAAPWAGGIARFTSDLAAGERLQAFPVAILTVTHPLLLAPYGRLIAAYRQAGGRVVMVCHNVLPHAPTPMAAVLTRRLLRLADAVLAHAASEAELAERLWPSGRIVRAFHPAGPAAT